TAVDRLSELCRSYDETGPDRVLDDLDIDFLREEIPGAIGESKEGLARVTEIVRAMKDFSHPGTDVADNDLNALIESTAAVCINEWKYVAELDFDLDQELPPVPCSGGQVKQVVLNLLVNAAHAVADAHPDGAKGRIEVRTRRLGELAEIRIEDDGTGMTDDVTQRVFDQFFTTKAVGIGTGQGLSMAWDVITGHGGTIEVESTPGVGTVFTVRLPLERAPDADDRSVPNRRRNRSSLSG
ncbi:MAG: ATP-binding protein, partial [Actinomycetota bacterium]